MKKRRKRTGRSANAGAAARAAALAAALSCALSWAGCAGTAPHSTASRVAADSLASSGDTVRVARLLIQGNHRIGTAELRSAMAIAPGAPADSTTERLAADRALALYRRAGYLRARAEIAYAPVSGGGAAGERDLLVRLEEGAAARLDSLTLDGCRGIPADRVRAELELRRGRPVDEAAIGADADRILRLYEEEGYPFASVAPRDFKLSPDGGLLSFRYLIDEGSRVRLKDLEVNGARVTRPMTIEREMRFARGDLYRQSVLDRGRDRLQRSGLFTEVSEIRLRPTSGGREVTAVLDVAEAPMNSAEAAVGYVPAQGASSGSYLTGLLDLSLGNIAGTGRQAEVHWRRLAPGSSSWKLGYTEPWLFGRPISLGGQIRQELRDSTYTTRGIDLNLVFPISDALDADLTGFRETTTTGSRGYGYVEESRRTGASGGFSLDWRDRVANPRRGGYTRLHGGWAKRSTSSDAGASGLPFSEKVGESTAQLEMGAYHPAWGDWVLAFEGEYREVRDSGAEVPYYELNFIGGSAGPRGYAEAQFAGARTGRGSFEYRYHLTPRSRFHLFSDFGYAAWNGSASTHWGYGAGLILESRLGLVGVDLGLPSGGTLADGKLHLRLRQEW